MNALVLFGIRIRMNVGGNGEPEIAFYLLDIGEYFVKTHRMLFQNYCKS